MRLWAVLSLVVFYGLLVFPVPWFVLRTRRRGRLFVLVWGAVVWVWAVLGVTLHWGGALQLVGWLGIWIVAVLATGGFLALVVLCRHDLR